MGNGMNGIEIFSIVMSFLSTIIVAWLGFLSVKREKADKAYRELQDELTAAKDAVQKKEETARSDEIKKIIKQLEIVTEDVKDMKERVDDTVRAVETVTNLSQFNLEYTAEINNALIILGSHMMVENPDRELLRKQLMEHQSKTSSITSKFYQTSF